ncbi:MAG: hypothetical protein K0Q70_2582 [Rhodospirillales bacterium]|nr:hypothetical protein [Rhodospirillales bacterium]
MDSAPAAGSQPEIRFIHSSVSETFPTLIWLADLDPQSYEPLNRKIMTTLDGITGPRVQSYRSETFQTDHVLHLQPEFAPVITAVAKLAKGGLQQMALKYDDIVITSMWANINPPGAKHSVHSHPNNFLSGVYYVQCDAKANVIRFHDPRPQSEVIMPPRLQQNVYNANMIELETKPGRLVLFPAWLKHDVPTNLSERERISVSFDMMFPRFTETMSMPLWKGGKNKGLR